MRLVLQCSQVIGPRGAPPDNGAGAGWL